MDKTILNQASRVQSSPSTTKQMDMGEISTPPKKKREGVHIVGPLKIMGMFIMQIQIKVNSFVFLCTSYTNLMINSTQYMLILS